MFLAVDAMKMLKHKCHSGVGYSGQLEDPERIKKNKGVGYSGQLKDPERIKKNWGVGYV